MITLFGKKQKEDGKVPAKKIEKKKEKKKEAPAKKPIKKAKVATGKSEVAWKSLHSPLISEKSTFLEKQGKYVFKALQRTNKPEIKKSIEDLYGVKVEKVNIVNIKRKSRKLGRTEGWKPGYKKAIVTLKKGEKIESSQK